MVSAVAKGRLNPLNYSADSGRLNSGIPRLKYNGSTGAPKSTANFSQKQLGKNFKHAPDFVEINTTKKNPATLKDFQKAIMKHLDDPATMDKDIWVCKRLKGFL